MNFYIILLVGGYLKKNIYIRGGTNKGGGITDTKLV